MDKTQRIHQRLREYADRGLAPFLTSSFQTQSVPLLHIVATAPVPVPVYFLNTGYHFPETLVFRDQLVRELSLDLRNLESTTPKIHQRGGDGRSLFTTDPDYCCFLNKVMPMDDVLARHGVWVSGVRRDQTTVRAQMNEEEPAKFGKLRYHPMLDWTADDVAAYQNAQGLPAHPLDDLGYPSIGCEPCTQKVSGSDGSRSARWSGLKKTECGLHTNLGREESKA